MNRLDNLFAKKNKNLLNIYFTAGHPKLHDTEDIIYALEAAGVDTIEIGMPYSDPLADGPTIQQSGMQALKNGMTVNLLFEQIERVRKKTQIPLVLMGNYNQVMRYGEEAFFRKCKTVGVDGLILPDLPIYVYEKEFHALFNELDLRMTFLIAPQTSEGRIRQIDDLSKGFIYMVSNTAITGAKEGLSEMQLDYFNRINTMGLKNPRMIGFGISDHETYKTACQFSSGAFIGSAFIKAIDKTANLQKTIKEFVEKIRPEAHLRLPTFT